MFTHYKGRKKESFMYKYLTTALNPTQVYLQVSKSYKISTNLERSTGFLIPAHHSNHLNQIMFLKLSQELYAGYKALIILGTRIGYKSGTANFFFIAIPNKSKLSACLFMQIIRVQHFDRKNSFTVPLSI